MCFMRGVEARACTAQTLHSFLSLLLRTSRALRRVVETDLCDLMPGRRLLYAHRPGPISELPRTDSASSNKHL